MELILFNGTEKGSDTRFDEDCFFIDTLIPLEKLAKTDIPDQWGEACKLVGKLVLNKVKELQGE